MAIATQTVDGKTLVSMGSRIDSANAADVERDLMGLVDEGRTCLAIDMSNLEYVSSAGLRVFLVLAKRLKSSGGAMALHSMNPNVREVFEISGFVKVLTVTETREDAVARL